MDLWQKLGKPRFVVAPMVDASELAWRMLCRRHGAELCYTPMLHSYVFTTSEKYRNEFLATCPGDRPLIVQFCANDANMLLQAAKMVEGMCDCIDINLGCPQSIAKRGHYGAFLQDEWDLLSDMVRTLRQNTSTPVSCKIRIFPEIDKSVEYARMLEASGCQMLTVHGRTREQKGPLTGVASWTHIKAIRDAVDIPVIANGNIQCLNDVYECLNKTGCQAVMSAEGILYNPALFEGTLVPVWEVALEYLQLTDLYPCPLSYMRGHLFKLFKHIFSIPENADLQRKVAVGRNRTDFLNATLLIKKRFEALHEGSKVWDYNTSDCNINLPPWICQPYVRMSPEKHLEKMQRLIETDRSTLNSRKEYIDPSKRSSDDLEISKKKQKRMLRRPKVNPNCRKSYENCSNCQNPVGLKCNYKLCKTCCKTKCIEETLDCIGHRIKVASRKATHLIDIKREQVEI